MLEVKDATAGYGPTTVLNGLSFEVGAGERLAMIGRNGVGKTTALRAVMGLVPLRAGTITFQGEDVTRLSAHQRAQRGLGYVPQTRDVFPSLSVEENLLAGLKHRPRAALSEAYELFRAWPSAAATGAPSSRGASSRCFRWRAPCWASPG